MYRLAWNCCNLISFQFCSVCDWRIVQCVWWRVVWLSSCAYCFGWCCEVQHACQCEPGTCEMILSVCTLSWVYNNNISGHTLCLIQLLIRAMVVSWLEGVASFQGWICTVQWTPSNPATLGTSQSVLIRGVASWFDSEMFGYEGPPVHISLDCKWFPPQSEWV